MASRKSFRIGRVRGDLRGKIWYLAYHENGQRQRPRIGPSKDSARQMAAEINAQLETGDPSALDFEPIPIGELQRRWLDHHEHVLRSSVRTIVRYRCATKHFVDFVERLGTVRTTAQFHVHHAERFASPPTGARTRPSGRFWPRGSSTSSRPPARCCRTRSDGRSRRRRAPLFARACSRRIRATGKG